jgi:hypothetical protein
MIVAAQPQSVAVRGVACGGVIDTIFSRGGQPMALNLAEANRVVEGALAKAKELNIKISVAVCDAGQSRGLGGLRASQR